MIEKYYKHIARAEYDLRFQAFLSSIINVSNLLPRGRRLDLLVGKMVLKYLETVMGVTTPDLAMKASNDNQKKNGE